MREIRMFELDGHQAVFWQSATPQSLQVLQGLLWVTVEGEPADHWLSAGETFEIRAGQRLWLGTWQDTARFRLSQPMALLPGRPEVHLGRGGSLRFAWHQLTHRVIRLRRGFAQWLAVDRRLTGR